MAKPKSVNKPAAKSLAKSAATSFAKPAKSVAKPAAKPAAKPVAKPAANSAAKSAAKPVAKPAANSAAKSPPKLAAKSVAPPPSKSVAKAAAKSVAPPAAKSVAPPPSSSVAKSAAKPAPPPAEKSVAPPAAKSVAPPPSSSVAKSAAKPAPPPAEKSVAPPAAKSVASPPSKSVATSAAKPAPPPDAAAAAPAPASATIGGDGLGWIDAGKGYALTLDGGKLTARNDKGKRLSSVPKELKDGDVADQLEALRDWLGEHDRECAATVDQWMLRSLPVPRAVLQQVWDDPAWRKPLDNAVVVAVTADGGHDHTKSGLLRGVDSKKGVGVVDLDGETTWLAVDRVAIPHPILINELDGWRELVTQLGVTQGVSQLHRETHLKPASLTGTSIDQFEDGKFAMLMHAVGKARSLGYKVSGGYATCKVWDKGGVCEARYWIGAESPDSETYTGQLSWVDDRDRGLAITSVGAVSFSEGMRMASAIYAARVVDKKEES